VKNTKLYVCGQSSTPRLAFYRARRPILVFQKKKIPNHKREVFLIEVSLLFERYLQGLPLHHRMKCCIC